MFFSEVDCEDKSPICFRFKSDCLSVVGIVYIRNLCPRTCSVCTPCSPAYRPCMPEGCVDQLGCLLMAKDCRHPQKGWLTRRTCPVTCQVCRPCLAPPPTQIQAKSCSNECEDERTDCNYLATARNYCSLTSQYREWMKAKCKKSCRICTKCSSPSSSPLIRPPGPPSSVIRPPGLPSSVIRPPPSSSPLIRPPSIPGFNILPVDPRYRTTTTIRPTTTTTTTTAPTTTTTTATTTTTTTVYSSEPPTSNRSKTFFRYILNVSIYISVSPSINAEGVCVPQYGNTVQDHCLNTHNYFRCLHGVPPLRYSDELQFSAQMYANFMASDGKLGYQSVRPSIIGIHREQFIGENLAWRMQRGNKYNIVRATSDWYGEGLYYDYIHPENATKKHFTQVVWKNTTQVGCAVARIGFQVYVVAHYKYAGNIPGLFAENVKPKLPNVCSAHCSVGRCQGHDGLSSTCACGRRMALPTCTGHCVVYCPKPASHVGLWERTCTGRRSCQCIPYGRGARYPGAYCT
ncbi:uncharacterized protein LOC100180998 [Ciona intestinalis]